MDRLFEDSFVHPSRLWHELERSDLPADMYQTANDIVIKATIPNKSKSRPKV
jgi:hypothetical protein